MVLFDHYHLRKELGRGAFSVVFKCVTTDTSQICAMKIINKNIFKNNNSSKLSNQWLSEIEILKKIKHANIIKYFEYLETESNIYIVLEYADGGELFEHVDRAGPFCESDSRLIFQQILDGVAYLHSQGICHRDLKLENILVHQGVIKITDFGLATLSKAKTFMKTSCGTPQYAGMFY